MSCRPGSTSLRGGELGGTAREALTEMRRLLGVLRTGEAAEQGPTPGLGDLPGLVDAARGAGLAVEFFQRGPLDGLPAAVGVCAYRIAQESLSNAGRHSPGAAISVTLDVEPAAVLLKICNGPPAAAPDGDVAQAPAGSDHRRGHGLAGMRERVTLLGGTFAAILGAQPGITVAGQAGDGAQAVSQARRLRPDVVLLDVRMPVMNGLAAARELLSGGQPRPRVLMLTTFDLDEYVYEALRAGASGFLLKDATTAELVHAVRVVAAGDALLAPSVTRRLIAGFARQHRDSRPPAGALDQLTPRETEVLSLIARGLSNAEISDTLVISEDTTKTHIRHILAKLNLRDRAQAVVIAYETGLVTPGG